MNLQIQKAKADKLFSLHRCENMLVLSAFDLLKINARE